MKRRIYILAGLTLLTAFTAYVSGRWAVLFIVPPVLLPAFLTLLAAVWLLLPCKTPASLWQRWLIRIAALVACWFFLRLPTYWGDGYFEMGRQAHIRSSFTPTLIAEIRACVSKLAAKKDKYGCVDLSKDDLPPAAVTTTWGMPRDATCFFDEQDRLESVSLIWGGSLMGRHGLVISDEQIPVHGYGYHGGGKNGQDSVEYPEHYYPLYPGSYIYLNDN